MTVAAGWCHRRETPQPWIARFPVHQPPICASCGPACSGPACTTCGPACTTQSGRPASRFSRFPAKLRNPWV